MGKIFFLTAVCAVLAASEAKFLTSDSSTRVDAKPVTLDDILTSKFSAGGFSGSWASDNEIQISRDGSWYNMNVLTGAESLVLNGDLFSDEEYQGKSLTFSADKKFVLITFDRQNVFRHSYLANYAIYDTQTNLTERIHPEGVTETKLQLFQWDPIGNGFVFVYGNNIYYRKAAIGVATVMLTHDGSATIFNGHSDWVYEEEMFGSPTALWFSKDASHLAYVWFNDTDVEVFEYPTYGEPGDREYVYPKLHELRYPKAGRPNPKTEVRVFNLNSLSLLHESTPLTYPVGDPEANRHYVATAAWRNNNELLVVHLNRAQNISSWYDCGVTVAAETCKKIHPIQSETAGWVDVYRPVFSADGESFLTVMPQTVEGGARYRQIVKVAVDTAATVPLTNQPISIDSILGWNEAGQKLYFSGTGLVDGKPDPSESQVYELSLTSGNGVARCLTCAVNNSDGVLCRSNSASLSKGFTYMLHSCSGPGVPETHVRKVENAESVRTLQNNTELRQKLKTVDLPQIKNFEIPLGDSGFTAKARLYLPASFDENKKYPLLIDVYGGPDSQNVQQGFSVNWGTSLVTDRDIIYGFIDGRGSGRQTTELLFQVYRQLGSVEIEDQITAAKWLIDTQSYIDSARTGIWGWSYGGYATAMTMVKDTENVFKCGISVAPVTSWLYYDSIYTERYMGLPTDADNNIGYDSGSVTTQVENFKNKTFFLVHGNADDNVHYHQSMILARALEKADVMFNQLSYPDEAHSINGPGMRRHLYHSLEKFLFRDCFPPVDSIEGNGANIKSASATLLILPLLYIALMNW